jgi:hypothetical protein
MGGRSCQWYRTGYGLHFLMIAQIREVACVLIGQNQIYNLRTWSPSLDIRSPRWGQNAILLWLLHFQPRGY